MLAGLDKYSEKFRTLHVHRNGKEISPHKPCLLLAVIDFAERGGLTKNKINILDTPTLTDMVLVNSFKKYLKVVKPRNPAKIGNPLLRLKSDGFWHLSPKDGHAGHVDKLPSDGGLDYKHLRDNVDFIYLDDELHGLLMDECARSTLREHLIAAWFPECQEEIYAAIAVRQEEFEYDRQLENPSKTNAPLPREEIRKTVFRQRVLSAYGYSCAATGLRFLMFDGSSLLEAAHIRPFADSHDDRTVNGMALQPTYHRAMDQFLIAPGPDRKWHASTSLDDRINGHKELKKIDGKELIPPVGEGKCEPDQQALEWRLNKLHDMDRQRK